jgi:ribulose-phosphate 3-epimerase
LKIRIAPSILSADFSRLAEQVRLLEQGGADSLHLDIMDGHFGPNLTFGPPVAAALRKVTSLPFDAHLMVNQPDLLLDAFAEAGSDSITVHAETCPHLYRTVEAVKALGLKVGVALNPATPLSSVEYVLDQVDLILLMTVNPGWGGQEFITGMYDKIRTLKRMIDACGHQPDLQVDGGINKANVEAAVTAGANCLVIGSALFGSGDIVDALQEYKRQVEQVRIPEAGRGQENPC